MRCAAAANPTGPAPITAIGRGSEGVIGIFDLSGMIEISGQKKSLGGCFFTADARCVQAALVHEETDETIHRDVVGAADEGGRLPFLGHQSG